MLRDAPIPEEVLALAAAATLFAVMLDVGLGIVPSGFRWVWQHAGRIAKGLFSVLIAVPAIALVVVRAFDLPRDADIGIVLMSISPGAPVALRRSLDAGGHRSFAPALQILVALLAVVAMPLWIAALNELYSGHATIAPDHLARQVFFAQLMPLSIGVALRRVAPGLAAALARRLGSIANALLLVLTLLVLVDVWRTVVDAGPRIVTAIAVITIVALVAGHALGGPEPGTRSAVAIVSAARNPGLALLVATLNVAPPGVVPTVFAYLVVSGVTVVAYVVWRRAAAARSARSTNQRGTSP